MGSLIEIEGIMITLSNTINKERDYYIPSAINLPLFIIERLIDRGLIKNIIIKDIIYYRIGDGSDD